MPLDLPDLPIGADTIRTGRVKWNAAISEIIDYINEGIEPSEHTHEIEDITGLQAALDDKASLTTDNQFAGLIKSVKTLSSNNPVLDLNQGYVFYSENTGAGGAPTRLWLSGPTGGEIIVGGRSSGSRLTRFRVRANNIVIDDPAYSGNYGWIVWHSGNDGTGSGLDADTVDGVEASAFALKTGTTFTGQVNFQGVINVDNAFTINNNAPIYGKDTGGTPQALISLSAGDLVTVGDTDVGLRLRSSGDPTVLIGSDTETLYHTGNLTPVQHGDPAPTNSQSGTSYTLVLSDSGKAIMMSNTAANTVTIPTNASVAFEVGTQVVVIQMGTGKTTVVADTGVTLNGVSAGSASISSRYGGILLQKTGTDAWIAPNATQEETFVIALSDEETDIEAATGVVTFRMPFAMTVTDLRASVGTAPTGSGIQIDINEGGSSILSTKLTIDDSETTSTTAATPYVLSDTSLADDALITVDIDSVGSTTPGKSLKLTIKGYRL